MDPLTRYLTILEECGGSQGELAQHGRWNLEQQWRRVYAARLRIATGVWKWQEYDWHVFSYHYSNALSGDLAIAEYVKLVAPLLIVIPEEHSFPSLPAFRLSAAKLPQFQGSGLDVLVWPEDLNWTMAFTHEEGWFGPYFSRLEWTVTGNQRGTGI